MKELKVQTGISVLGNFQISIQHKYPVPYERDDTLLRIQADDNPFVTDSSLEPEQGKTLYADVNFEYNYYVPQLENASTMLANTDTKYLPSMNYFLLDELGKFPDSSYAVFSSLAGNVYTSRMFNGEYESHTLSKQYFEDYGTVLSTLYDNSVMKDRIDREYATDIFDIEYISKECLGIYKDNENKREMYPFFAKINMVGMPHSQLAGILEEADMDKVFIDFLVMHRNDYPILNTDIEDQAGNPVDGDVLVYSHDTFLTHLTNHGGQSHTFSPYSSTSQSECDFLENYIRIEIAKSRLADYVARNAASHKTEPIAYRLEKYDSESGFNLLQVNYFFNLKDLNDFRFYDTQVSYGKHYTYRIKVINALFVNNSAARQYLGDLVYLEEPYYEDHFILLDSPPIAPDVELLTYRGVSDKVLIMFNSMVDKRVEVPITINPSDVDSIANQYEAQKIRAGNPILFESDDPTMFEIFRLDSKPSSYEDFVKGKYHIVGKMNRTSAAYKDTIAPNRYYYYTFRALDVHGFPSNPTEVYEFRLNKEGETMYPSIRIVDFKAKDPPSQKNISFKRYLKIGLNASQYQIPNSEISRIGTPDIINTDIQIGTSTEPLAGSDRKFKFRIKSKNTGKMFDINVTFKKNKVFRE